MQEKAWEALLSPRGRPPTSYILPPILLAKTGLQDHSQAHLFVYCLWELFSLWQAQHVTQWPGKLRIFPFQNKLQELNFFHRLFQKETGYMWLLTSTQISKCSAKVTV